MKGTSVAIKPWLPSGLRHGGLECTRILNEITQSTNSGVNTDAKFRWIFPRWIFSVKESLHPQERTA